MTTGLNAKMLTLAGIIGIVIDYDVSMMFAMK